MTDTALAALLATVDPVSAAFVEAGHQVYLVGGIVRDHLLGRDIDAAADLDLTTDAHPDAIKVIVEPLADSVWTQGERFGTIGCRIGGRVYEITTHRAERYDIDSRKPEVDFSTEVVDDLSRRDFTINAMARRLPGGDLVDPFRGRDDLARGRLMTPLEPQLSFTDDPLRMLRAARFAATYDFTVDPAVEAAISGLVDRLAIVSTERIRDELLRLLRADDPAPGLDLLRRTGLAARFLPELGSHDATMLAGTAPDPMLRLSVILATAPSGPTPERLRQMRLGNDEVATVTRMVGAVESLDGLDDESIRRFVVASRPDTERAVALAAATQHQHGANLGEAVAGLLEREGGDDLAPAVTGGELIDELGLEPGPLVGELMAWLGDQRLRNGPASRDQTLVAAQAWLERRSSP